MKTFVIVCLLAAIGAVGLIAKGEAHSIDEFRAVQEILLITGK